MRVKKLSFATISIFRIGMVAGLVITVLAMIWGWREYALLDRELGHDLQAYEAERKAVLERTVRDAVRTIEFMRARADDDLQANIRDKVEQALAIAAGICAGARATNDCRANAKTVRDALREVRIDGGRGRYFAFDLDGVGQLFPIDPNSEGIAMSSLDDDRARAVAEMLNIVKRDGEGFYHYPRTRPDTPLQNHEKIAFVKVFKPLGWVIGTGDYIEDFDARVKTRVLAYLEALKFSDTGTVFAATWDGLSLTEPAKGRNMWEVTDVNGFKVVQALAGVAKAGGGFVQYVMPAINGGPTYRKISYVAGIPDWRWYVGAGDSLEAIEFDLAKRRAAGRERIVGEVGFIALISLIFIGVIVFQTRVTGGRARGDFQAFLGFLRDAATTKASLDPSRMEFAEFEELAHAANRMIEDRHKALLEVERQRTALNRAKDELELRVQERTQALAAEVIERMQIEAELKRVNELLEQRVEERTRDLREQITERERVEDQFIHAQKMEAVGQLAGGFAHDFNNILTVIVGTLGAVQARLQSDEIALRAVRLAQEATKRASNLTRRMLVFSREMATHPEVVDLGEMMVALRPLIARAFRESIDFSVDCAPNVWPVNVDPVLLENAMVNIALNAQDAMTESGRFSLRIGNRHVRANEFAGNPGARAGDFVEIAMSDTGTGIPPEIIEKIFEPFFTTKGVGKGTGLGLSMVQTFARRSQGFVTVASEVGRGTTVSIFIPRSEGAISVVGGQDVAKAEASLQGKRAIVVEDDPLVREVTASFLHSRGMEVTEFADGPSALSAMEMGSSFDLMISDLIMPGGMSGVELHDVVRKRWPSCRILLVTGYSRDEFRRIGVDPGSVRLLRKPFTMNELIEALAALAGGT